MINIKKKPIPEELSKLVKLTKNYRHQDVVEKIKQDFNNKCYICELKESTSINVEHFIPHRKDEELKYKWSNLYFACSHCNGIKGAKYDNILDPLNEDEDVECRIKCKMDTIPMAEVKVSTLENDKKTENTVMLLNEVFNSNTPSAPVRNNESQNLRKKLLDDLMDFQTSLYTYYYEKDFLEDKEKAKKSIIRHLSGTSQFTAFKRCLVIENDQINTDFHQYFNEI